MIIIDDFYRPLLESCTVVVTDDGEVLKPNKKKIPFTVNGKEVMLPIKPLLKANNWENIHPFHPLCEDALMGQSETLHFLNEVIRRSLTSRYCKLIGQIFLVAADKELQHQLKNPKAVKAMGAYTDAKKSTITAWDRITNAMTSQFILNIYIGRTVTKGGVVYQRNGVVTCPILENVVDKEVAGVDTTKKDGEGIRSMVSWVLKPLVTTYYSNHVTPYFDILLQHYVSAANRYNEILTMFSGVIEEELIDLSWVDAYDNVEKIRKTIPQLPGNVGTKLETSDVRDVVSVDSNDDDDIFAGSDVTSRSVHTKSERSVDPTRRERVPAETTGYTLDSMFSTSSQLDNGRGRDRGGRGRDRDDRDGRYDRDDRNSRDRNSRERDTRGRSDRDSRDTRGRSDRDSRDDRGRSRGRSGGFSIMDM